MLDKKALESAVLTISRARSDCAAQGILASSELWEEKIARATIEAYLAALPDDGLVKEMRERANDCDIGDKEPNLQRLLREAADALELARLSPRPWTEPGQDGKSYCPIGGCEVRVETSDEGTSHYVLAAAPEVSDDR